MNNFPSPIYFLTADSPCNTGDSVSIPSVMQTGDGRMIVAANSRARASRINTRRPPPILIKLAMKMSRARWYGFLRRVFHYQNGSGQDLGPNPFDSGGWMLVEFVSLVVQISVTAHTLIVSQGESPVWPMRIWVSGYALGCFLSLVLLLWRYRVVLVFHGDPNPNFSQIEHHRSHEESRSLQKLRTSVELLFAIWFVMGNIWVFDSRFRAYGGAPKLHVLCISLLAWNAVSYSFPFILFVLLCCFVPFVSRLLGYNINTASRDRGATDDQIATLRCWRYKVDYVGRDLELGNENLECCICLAKYMEKEEIRELPCTHIFHLTCVDQWLRITSSCPLCKQPISK